MRTCKRCLELKPESEFGVNRAIPDGKHLYCKQCCREKKAALQERIQEMRSNQYWARRRSIEVVK